MTKYKTEADSDTKNKQVVARGERDGGEDQQDKSECLGKRDHRENLPVCLAGVAGTGVP